MGRGDERGRRKGETNLVVGGMKANTVCVSDWSDQHAWCPPCRPEMCVFKHALCTDVTEMYKQIHINIFVQCDELLPTVFGFFIPLWLYIVSSIVCIRIHVTQYIVKIWIIHDGTMTRLHVQSNHWLPIAKIFPIFASHFYTLTVCFLAYLLLLVFLSHFYPSSLDERMLSSLSLLFTLYCLKKVGCVKHIH